MVVTVILPGSLADLAGEPRVISVDLEPAGDEATRERTLQDLLDVLALRHPGLERRIRDEAGAVRRHVSVFVDGEDIRALGGPAAVVRAGAQVHVLPSVSGG